MGETIRLRVNPDMVVVDGPHAGSPLDCAFPEQADSTPIRTAVQTAMDGQPVGLTIQRSSVPWRLLALPGDATITLTGAPAAVAPADPRALFAEFALQGAAIRPMAHNVNNQLGAICNYAALLEHQLQGQHKKELENIQQLSFQAADQLNSLRALTAPAEEAIVQVELTRWLSNSVARARTRHPKHSFHLSTLPNLTFPAASEALSKAMDGLLDNAAEACTKARAIHISAHTARLESEDVADWDATAGPFLHIELNDTGCGFPSANIQAFMRLYQGSHPGRGVGLPLVFSAARQHRGLLRITSAPDLGTTAVLSVPLQPQTIARAPKTGFSQTQTAPVTQTLLLADDTPAVLKATARLLQRAGYTVVPAKNGAEVLSLFDAAPNQFDAALLDGNMPELGGVELAGQLTQKRPDLPVLLLTGGSLPTDCTWPILDKPYRPKQLLSMLRTLFH